MQSFSLLMDSDHRFSQEHPEDSTFA